MIVFPNCKINIGLRITGKRADGYHSLETIFYPVPLYDVLEAVPAGVHSFTQTGLSIPGDKNICQKALEIFTSRFALPPLAIHLHKTIPAGAGLGGGSSDGAFMLKLLSEFSEQKPPEVSLGKMALDLGSDCPFFLENKPVFASGRGEEMLPVEIDLKGYYLVLVNPGIHMSTAASFAGLQSLSEKGSLQPLQKLPVSAWKEVALNDFEEPAFKKFPELKEIKDFLYAAGAEYASMTGTGSTLYGLFRFDYHPKEFPSSWFIRTLEL